MTHRGLLTWPMDVCIVYCGIAAGVEPTVQAAAMVLLKEHMDQPAQMEKHMVRSMT